MNYEKYEFFLVSADLLVFQFYSEGPKGIIPIQVQFQRMNVRMFNLVFGSLIENSTINDEANLRNHDRDKILATVAAAVSEFIGAFPDRVIFFTGSTPSRCRLYRMAIGINFDQLATSYDIFGVVFSSGKFRLERFIKNKDYQEFIIERIKL